MLPLTRLAKPKQTQYRRTLLHPKWPRSLQTKLILLLLLLPKLRTLLLQTRPTLLLPKLLLPKARALKRTRKQRTRPTLLLPNLRTLKQAALLLMLLPSPTEMQTLALMQQPKLMLLSRSRKSRT